MGRSENLPRSLDPEIDDWTLRRVSFEPLKTSQLGLRPPLSHYFYAFPGVFSESLSHSL
jgi:hypothetical protein